MTTQTFKIGKLIESGGGTSFNSFRTKISFSVNGVDVQQNSLDLYQIKLFAVPEAGEPAIIFNVGTGNSDIFKPDVNYPVIITSDISSYKVSVLGISLEFILPESVDGLTCKLLINNVEVANNIAFEFINTSSEIIIDNINGGAVIPIMITPELANAWKNSFLQEEAVLDFKFVFVPQQ